MFYALYSNNLIISQLKDFLKNNVLCRYKVVYFVVILQPK